MKALNASNQTVIQLMAATLLLLFAGQVAAFDYSTLPSAPPEMHQCMKEKLDTGKMEYVHSGQRPKDKRTRKAIRTTYEMCLAAAGTSRDNPTYDGPLFDAMSQIDEMVDMDQAIRNVRAAGVTKLALFARSRKRLHQNEQAVLDLAARNTDLIILGAPKYFRLSDDISHAYIDSTVEGIRKHGYKFIGEILYTHGDKSTGKQYARGERYIDPSLPGTARLMEALAPLKLPVMVHWEPYAPKRDFPRFHALYAAWPNQVFILPHMGFATAETIDDFMSMHPNLHALTSKKERLMDNFSDPAKKALIGPSMLEDGVLRPDWKSLLIKYQDRILFGTDPHMKKLWNKYGKIVSDQRRILGQLPREVAEKIAYKNAEKLYGVRLNETAQDNN
ncbi:amidohydrolase family protein [uncultured Pseudodesulfovibrio sp.]|uniref:amidohydrolase family protein n=1 Tax=uncultured Pseudodesulfovibrio sp. TaxID=2035858 RepID=UPI0029C90C45|nr:amidohydrolase family protein [uncultured Pseudodesulfovibrio sp.]